MRLITIGLTAAIAILGLTISRGMRRPPVPVEADTSTPKGLRPAPPVEASDRSVIGTLERVDVASGDITVATGTGRLVFRVPSGATVRQGSKTLKPPDLAVHKGERAKVRYHESGRERRADWIVLAAPARHPPKDAERHTGPGIEP